MIENAWRRQNLLAESHFTADNSLSPAGQKKVRWILTQAPTQHRTIYVRRGETAEETVARVNSIRQYAVKALPDVPPPNVLETHISPAGYPAGWPGAKDETLLRKFQPSVPSNLYLPDRGASSSGGGSQ
jgi:hypothetical protein